MRWNPLPSKIHHSSALLVLVLFGLTTIQAPANGQNSNQKILVPPDCSTSSTLCSHFLQKRTALYTMHYETGSSFNSPGEELLNLDFGSFIIYCKETMPVRTPGTSFELPKGAMALLRISNNSTRVLSFLKPFTVLIHNESYRLGAGQMLVSTSFKQRGYEVTGEFELPLRNVHISADSKTTSAEFMFTEAVKIDPILRNLWLSEMPDERILKNKLVKTAAIETEPHARYWVVTEQSKCCKPPPTGVTWTPSSGWRGIIPAVSTQDQLENQFGTPVNAPPEPDPDPEHPGHYVIGQRFYFQDKSIEAVVLRDKITELVIHPSKERESLMPIDLKSIRAMFGNLYFAYAKRDGSTVYSGYGIKVVCDSDANTVTSVILTCPSVKNLYSTFRSL